MTENNTHSDEIDLKDLIRAIIATRVHLLIALISVAALFWTVVILLNIVKPPINTSSINFYLTFKGAPDAEYPNKSPFQLYDIIAPVILNRVYDQVDASAYLDRSEFVSGFTIAPYIPDIDLINAKYNLDTKGLSQAELDNLQKQLRQELNQASSSAAQVRFSTTKSNIPEELMVKALRKVPEVWADQMVNSVGVTDFDVTIYSDKVVDSSLIQSMDYLIAFEMILDKVRLLNLNLDEIIKLPNGQLVQDPESGLTAPDLRRAIGDSEKYLIAPLVTPIKNLGISKDSEIVKLYFEDQLLELQRVKGLAEKKRDNLENAYNTYVNNQSENSTRTGGKGGVSPGSVIPQFGTEFLDRIVDLTNAGVDIEFRQDMTKKQIELSDKLSEIESEVDRVQEVITALDKPKNTEKDSKVYQAYSEKAERELPIILSKLVEYFGISNRIYDTVSSEALGSEGSLYKLINNEVEFKSSHPILNSNNFKFFLIALFLTMVVVVPLSMIRNSLKPESSD